MAAVKAGQDEERRAEVVPRDRLALVKDELVPLEGLEAEEHHAAQDGEHEELPETALIALPDRGQRLDHRDAAADEQERHQRRQLDAEDARRPRPGGVAVAERPVAGEQAAERHGVGAEEYPHAELSPALGGERGFGRFQGLLVCDRCVTHVG